MSKSKIYAVASGEHDEYGVRALYSSCTDAEAVVTQLNAARGPLDEYRVEEFDFYSEGDRSLRSTSLFCSSVLVTDDGLIGEIESYSSNTVCDDPDLVAMVENSRPVYRYGNAGWRVVLNGIDLQHTVKALRERAAQVAQAVSEGLDPRTLQRTPVASLQAALVEDYADGNES